jgi:hypothetical protein
LIQFQIHIKTGVLPSAAPYPNCSAKNRCFTFSKVFSSFTISFPETSFKVKLSYKTVVAFAISVQFKKAGFHCFGFAAAVADFVLSSCHKING